MYYCYVIEIEISFRCDEELILEEHLDPNIGDKYLTLDQLGYVLRNIRTQLPGGYSNF